MRKYKNTLIFLSKTSQKIACNLLFVLWNVEADDIICSKTKTTGKYFKALLFSFLNSRIHHHLQIYFTNDIHLFNSHNSGTKIV